jgi:hypothetical protein
LHLAGPVYSRAFFELQLQFAYKVAELSGLPWARVLLDYTNLYIRFGLGRDFAPAHPIWRQYVAGLEDAPDRRDWTYRFYLTRSEAMAAPPVVATFGCFSYAFSPDDRIRLHFRNTDPVGHSPLGIDRVGQRLADLTALFAHVKRTRGRPLQVVGASWLYNLTAYRRLFPASYVATARLIGGRFRHMPLWGQFLNRSGELRESVARVFQERLERQLSVDGLDQCFPLQVLSLEAPVADFYDFYGIRVSEGPLDDKSR